MENKEKKVLVIGESFHKLSGGGITMSNLFANWSSSNLAVAASPKSISKMKANRVKSIYSFGTKEFKMKLPFYFLEKNYTSKIIDPKGTRSIEDNTLFQNNRKSKIKVKLVEYFLKITHYLGIYHIINTTCLSDEFLDWINSFKPDYIYTQLSQRNLIQLITLVYQKTKIPFIIHIMDDWPKTINKSGIFKIYWDRKIDKEFRYLLKNSFENIAISQFMATEYKSRYGGNWKFFHNPINILDWEDRRKNNYSFNHKKNILYIGRIGTANKNSITNFCKIVNSLNKMNKLNIVFDIYTHDYSLFQNLNSNYVHIRPPIAHSKVPGLISNYSLLYLPLDFDKKGKLFSKYSLPTKLSEYMISGVPIFINAPTKTAVVEYCLQHTIAYVCTTNNSFDIERKLIEVYSDLRVYEKIGKRASDFAKFNHDIIKVQTEFGKIFN